MALIRLAGGQQKTAAGAVILMISLCSFDHRHDFDMPHSHTEFPVMPPTSASVRASATSTAALGLYLPLIESRNNR